MACASDRLRVLKIEKLSILRLPAVEIEVKRGEAMNQVRPSPYLGSGVVVSKDDGPAGASRFDAPAGPSFSQEKRRRLLPLRGASSSISTDVSRNTRKYHTEAR